MIGVALYGSGIRGVAGYGVLHAMKEIGVRAGAVCATGLAASAAAFFAAGIDEQQTSSLLKHITARKTLHKDHYNEKSIFLHFDNSPLAGTIERLLAMRLAQSGIKRLDDFEISLLLLCTDLITGKLAVAAPRGRFSGGNGYPALDGIRAATAVRGAMAMPGLLEPRRYAGLKLCDAGIRIGLPILPLRCIGAERILAVKVCGNQLEKDFEARAAQIAGSTILKSSSTAAADYVLTIQLTENGQSDIDALIRAGEEAVYNHVYDIVDALYFKK
jgi:predicted acylesterase/phospholipase RssA